MNEHRHNSLKKLADYNGAVLRRLFGDEFIKRSQSGALAPDETRSANYKLAEYLYSPEVARHVYSNDNAWLDIQYNQMLAEAMKNRVGLEWEKLGLIVVRPELYYAREAVAQFLLSNNFQIVDQRPVTLSFSQYWLLYHHGLIDPDSQEDFPTRTLSYIDQPCWLILFDDPARRYKEALSDGFSNEFKGSRGKMQPGTLRGDLVATEMIAMGANIPLSPEAALAFDPIQSYRHIIKGTIASDEAHANADTPFLFYAGVGVHVPEAHELVRDVTVLYSNKELLRISSEYNRRNYSQV